MLTFLFLPKAKGYISFKPLLNSHAASLETQSAIRDRILRFFTSCSFEDQKTPLHYKLQNVPHLKVLTRSHNIAAKANPLSIRTIFFQTSFYSSY